MVRVVDVTRLPGPPGAENVLAAPIGPEDQLRTVGPFALVAHHRTAPIPAGVLPVDADIRPHPHIGVAAITYLLAGHVTHRDSLGNRHEIGPGGAGYLIAGRGTVHSERFERLRLLGGPLDLFQLLLALPDGAEDVDPSFRFVPPEQVPVTRADGIEVRWLLHPSSDLGAPLRFPAPAVLGDATLEPGARWSPPEADERAVYVQHGEVTAGDARIVAGQVGLLSAEAPPLRASEPSRLLLFGGAPAGPRWLWWNYLHGSLDRIEAAKAEWREGRVPLPTGDTESFTPAPPDHGRPLRRLNARHER